MKKSIVILVIVACLVAALLLPACSAADRNKGSYYSPNYSTNGANSANYVYDGSTKEQDFSFTEDETTSYFSLDKNTANYSMVRNQINRGWTITPESVRVEELINYFDYPLPSPAEGDALGISASLMDCPWNSENKLMMVGVKTDEISVTATNGNYVFLIDVSGSMMGSDRLGLAKTGIKKLINNLGEGDVISIVTYANDTNLVADGLECVGDQKATLLAKVSALQANGSTYGQGGLTLAYSAAEKHFIEGGNNRIVLISDGDFNVGMSSVTQMKEFIQNKAQKGIYLSVFGVGMGNTRDDMLETLARNGNGSYAYLDTEKEAERAFGEGLNGTLITVAKDAKASVTFNADNVEKFRLIGYDSKRLTQEDYENDKTDAGEIGSGLCVLALYEITLKEDAEGALATAEVKYKDVRGEKNDNASVSTDITTETESSLSLQFAAGVAEFGLLLRNSEYKGTASYEAIIARLNDLSEFYDGDEAKAEFYELVNKLAA